MPRHAGLHSLALLALLAALTGCASGPVAAPPRAALPADLEPFLIDPTEPADSDPDALRVQRLFRQLIETGDAAAVEAGARALLGQRQDLDGARILLAQALLVRGGAPAAVDAVRAAGEATGLAGWLVEARALEGLGDLPAALFKYRQSASRSPAAAQRASALEPRAVELLTQRIGEALAGDRLEAAERDLALLAVLRPHAETTLRFERRVALARGDTLRELALVRSLVAAVPGDADLALRRAQLEVEVGDARVGLELLRGLAAASPEDTRLADELRRTTFRWRVANAPEPVRRSATRPQATRADLAVMLYWLVPQVRTARAGSARIASDALDHPAQEAIVRVVNLGLLGVDESLHRFEPDRAAQRADLYRALLRLLVASDPDGCARPQDAVVGEARRDALCRSAVACGLAPSAAECLASAPLSGAEALEALRRALEILERS